VQVVVSLPSCLQHLAQNDLLLLQILHVVLRLVTQLLQDKKSTLDTDKARIPVVVIGISVAFYHAIISFQFRSNWINFETPEAKYLEILANPTE
jgi:hypothetical protein